MNKRKICFITPSLRAGGMERVLSLLSNFAVSRGYSVFIILLINNKIEYQLNPSVKIYFPQKVYKKGLKNKLYTLYYLCKTLKDINPYTTLCFSEVFNPLAIVASRLVRKPIYISDRSNPYKKLRLSIKLFRRFTYPLADGIIAQTLKSKEYSHSKRYNKNIITIPNPLKQINDSYHKKYEKRIVSAGRLVKSKNFSELIDIFNSIRDKGGWELIILGEGPERSNLQSKIEALGLCDSIKLVGLVEDVDYYYSCSSIFAFTSLSEGFPNALSEAMAFPLSCIAYDCPVGPSDIIQTNINGLLIPIHDKLEYIYQLQKLMQSTATQKRYRESAKLNRSLFSNEKISNSYLDFILKDI